MKMLIAYGNPVARTELLARHPELAAALDLCAALLRVQRDEAYDAPARRQATTVSRAILRYVGYVQETERAHLTIGQELALCRLKQACRDTLLTLPWPYNRDGGYVKLMLTQRALDALARLGHYDYLAGPATYPTAMGHDVATLVAGTHLAPLT